MQLSQTDFGGEDHTKLKELILYISQKCQDHDKFGKIKLNKILFYADFVSYARRGRSITNETYFKLPMGPAPKKMKPVADEMEKSGDMVLQKRFSLSKPQERWIPMREPRLEEFDGFEISLVDEVIDALKDRNADQVIELSHQFMGWQLVREREDIPYQTVFLRDPDEVLVTEERKKRAKELIDTYRLQ